MATLKTAYDYRFLMIVVAVFFVSSVQQLHAAPDPYGRINSLQSTKSTIQKVELIDHLKRPFKFNQLEGDLVLLNFIFTSCNTICPLQTHHLNEMREKLKAKHPEVSLSFVSVTITPELDRPKKLREYADGYQIPHKDNWYFLTGKKSNVEELMDILGMQAFLNEENILDHLTTLYLFDTKGLLKKQYKGKIFNESYIINELVALNSIYKKNPR